MQKEQTSPLKNRWPNPTISGLFQSSCLNGCFWKFWGCFFLNFQKSLISEWLLLRFTLSFSWVFCEQKQPPNVFCKKVPLNNFAIFTGKHLCSNLFLIKLQAFKSLVRVSNICVFLWILQKHPFWETSANWCCCIKVSYLCFITVMLHVILFNYYTERHSICNIIFSLIFRFFIIS